MKLNFKDLKLIKTKYYILHKENNRLHISNGSISLVEGTFKQDLGVVYHLTKNPSGFKLCKWNAKMSIGKSHSEHALSISHKIGKNRKYIVKGLELDGKPSKM